MSNFQLIVVGLFVTFIVLGVGAFALFGGVFGGAGTGPVVVWGTMPQQTIEFVLESMQQTDGTFQDVSYLEVPAASYEATLLNAMASGQAPDLFMLTQEQLGVFSDKILVIPYAAVSQSEFLNSYVDEGQLFLTPQGALALPFAIDPLVMYWNRDIFTAAGLASPPQSWNDFLTLAPKLISFDSSQNIKRSGVAMGTWQNVFHAKEILSALFLQAGEGIVVRTQEGGLLSTFGLTPEGVANNPAESALRFYTEFGNPSKTTYSWNRSLPRSDSAFTSGMLGVYFGYASEVESIAERNPNLRFGVARMPQLQGTGAVMTYGKLTGLAVPRMARNPAGAGQVAQKLTGPQASAALMQATRLPSANRNVALDAQASAAAEVFNQSALIARAWIDPNAPRTSEVFKTMIESVISGRLDPATAVSEASQEFASMLGN